MEATVIKATRRTLIGKQSSQLRRAGQLPAVVYGKHIEPTPICLDMREASRVLAGVSSSHLVTIDLEGTPINALVRERQRNPLKDSLVHVDFLAVSMTERLRAMVQIVLHGEALAVKQNVGVLVSGVEEIEVECLPADLPETIVVDVTGLKEVGDSVKVADLPIDTTKVEVLTDAEELVALITAPTAEEIEAEVSAEEPEVIEKGKKEEEN